MKIANWVPVEIGIFDGFKIILSFEEEYMNPKHHFIDECQWEELD